MWHVYAFATLFLVSSLVALAIGGAPERIVAATLVAASILSVLAGHLIPPTYVHADRALVLIDLAATLVILGVALRANRVWPMWVAALMLQQVLGHVLKIADPTLFPWLYWLTSSLWGYPIQTILLVAAIVHHRRRTTAPARSWSDFSRRSERTPRPPARTGSSRNSDR